MTKIKDSNYALLINNLASAYSIIGDAKNAELNYLEELELVKSFFGENDKIVAFTYRNLGNVYLAANQGKQAEIYFIKSLTIFSAIKFWSKSEHN